MADTRTRAVLLDIEGTTTPVEFVYQVLFPFARRHVREFIRQGRRSEEVLADISGLKEEHRADIVRGLDPPAWREDSTDAQLESVAEYARWLMDRDRKTTALKSLQGKIWEAGYRDGRLRGEVYPDVPPAFARWRRQQRGVYIFSSGSVLAQKLLFAHTTEGDLTAHISGYFDTSVGAKTDAASYKTISARVGAPAAEILFVSDVTAELDAAKAAGMGATLCVRPGRPEPEVSAHPIVRTFDAVFP